MCSSSRASLELPRPSILHDPTPLYLRTRSFYAFASCFVCAHGSCGCCAGSFCPHTYVCLHLWQVTLVRRPLEAWPIGHEELDSTAPPSAYESCMSNDSSPPDRLLRSEAAAVEEGRLLQGSIEVRVIGRSESEPNRKNGVAGRRGKPPSCPSTPPSTPREGGAAGTGDVQIRDNDSRQRQGRGMQDNRVLSEYYGRSDASDGIRLAHLAALPGEKNGAPLEDPDEEVCFFA